MKKATISVKDATGIDFSTLKLADPKVPTLELPSGDEGDGPPEPTSSPVRREVVAPVTLTGLVSGYPIDNRGKRIPHALLVNVLKDNRIKTLACFNVVNVDNIKMGDICSFVRSVGNTGKVRTNFASHMSLGKSPGPEDFLEGFALTKKEIQLVALEAVNWDITILKGLTFEEIALTAGYDFSGITLPGKVTRYIVTKV